MDICIHEGNEENIVHIGQIKPLLSAIKQSSISCVPTDSIISNGTSDTQTTIEAPNDEAVVSENDATTSETFRTPKSTMASQTTTVKSMTSAMRRAATASALAAPPATATATATATAPAAATATAAAAAAAITTQISDTAETTESSSDPIDEYDSDSQS